MGKKKNKETASQGLTEAQNKHSALIEHHEDFGAPEDAPTGAAHPEEMKAAVDLRIADRVTLKATARATPAGLVGIAILISAILLPLAWGRR